MDNAAIANVFNELADLTEIQGGDPHRVRAFRRVARILEGLREPVASMIRFRSLEKVPGIGEGTVHRIKEILRSGTCSDYSDLTHSMPPGLRDMVKIPGVGVKTVRHLYLHERIASVDALEFAARSGRLARLPGFGENAGDRILAAIARFRRKVGRLLLTDALGIGNLMRDAIRAEPACIAAELTGSARRRKETVGDLDILVASHDPAPCIARFVTLPVIEEVIVRGDSKCSATIRTGQQVDLRVIPPESYGAGLHYFTGSQQHNIYLRARGNRRQLKISEHGVFRRADEKLINSCESESEIFEAVGLPFIPPELRENTGEIEAAAKGKLPRLIEERELKGDLHLHTRASEGATATVRELVQAAADRGLRYIAMADHARAIRGGFDDLIPRLRRAGDAAGVEVLAGIEVHLLPDGTLDADSAMLERADFVVATVQSAFDLPRKEMTARVVAAMETGLVDLVGHPLGRIIDEQKPSDFDVEKLLKAARRADVAMEIHGDPRRLDLDASAARYAGELGIPLALSSGAGAAPELARLTNAIHVARRGWLEAKDVLNTRDVEEILQRRRDRLRKRGVVVEGALARPRLRGRKKGAALVPATIDLDAALQARPLAPWVVERLEAFLHSQDAELEAALGRLPGGRNAAQKAFDLLHGS